jgi:hypothetical protein
MKANIPPARRLIPQGAASEEIRLPATDAMERPILPDKTEKAGLRRMANACFNARCHSDTTE